MSLNLTSKNTLKALFNQYGISPSKRLGQNFLIDKFSVKKVVKAANLTRKDSVLEVGPGLGVLTQELAQKAKKIIAVEKDHHLARILNSELRIRNIKNVEIIEADILKAHNLQFIIHNSYKVVANLPFYLTAPFIRRFLERKNPPKEMILVVQKEVGQRICAQPPRMNLLAISVQFYAKPQIVSYISKRSFWPEPKVDSAVIKITINKKQLTVKKELFFKIVKAGFSQPRKQILNSLAKKLNIKKGKIKEILQKNNISPSQRPETLELEDWQHLTQDFFKFALL